MGKDIEPLISIVIPVYNGEKTLDRCVSSVLGQSFRNFELILVDDGSSDGSLEMCRNFAARDSRVRILARENGGVSAARNAGMAAARGKYLQFADCDDWLDRRAAELMVKKAENFGCDMVITDFFRVVGGNAGRKGGIPDRGVLTRREYASYMMEEPANFYYGVMWNKLYRRDIVTANGLQCCTDVQWCEDFMFNLEYIRCAETFASVAQPLYYYIKSPTSLAEQESSLPRSIKMKIELFSIYKDLFEDMDIYEENRLKVTKFLVSYARDNNVRPEGAARRIIIKENMAQRKNTRRAAHSADWRQSRENRLWRKK